jgi:hypothetical protein
MLQNKRNEMTRNQKRGSEKGKQNKNTPLGRSPSNQLVGQPTKPAMFSRRFH